MDEMNTKMQRRIGALSIYTLAIRRSEGTGPKLVKQAEFSTIRADLDKWLRQDEQVVRQSNGAVLDGVISSPIGIYYLYIQLVRRRRAMADPFNIGIIEALFKVIEERVPYGRQITTVASVLVVFGIIVFVSQFLMATLVAPLGGALPHIASFIRNLSGFHLPFFRPVPPEVQQAFLPILTLLTILDLLIVVIIRLETGQSKNRDGELQKRLDTLEKTVGVEK
jgi:hypothetical protein